MGCGQFGYLEQRPSSNPKLTKTKVGDIWDSTYGKVKVIAFEIKSRGREEVRIRFLDTGGVRTVSPIQLVSRKYSDFEVTKPRVEGCIMESDNCGRFIVRSELDPKVNKSKQKVWIKFLNTGGIRLAHWPNVSRGDIHDLYKPSYAGVGYLGWGKYEKGKGAGSPGLLWTGILRRTVPGYCVSDKNQSYHNIEAKMCEEWHNFQNFAEWFYNEPHHDKKGWDLDKDMKVFGSKVYSPETCCFLPKELNNLLFFDHYNKGYERRGVWRDGDTWQAHSGSERGKGFLSSKEAFLWYKKKKEEECLRLADKWEGIVDQQVINNLRNLDIQPQFAD